ncbi:MAG TPA: efflux RND transporter periplasmic adaptor subunit, partial [Desulfobulbus sp.]|nr:efflux RND transporter periplasmic adaptor subunit [Desulfobulbus sp.]
PVEVLRVQPVDFPVTISGYGDVVARTAVTLSAEVSGRITFKRDLLLAGRVVEKGAVLFEIDKQDFQLDLATAESLLKILTRDQEIAGAELERVSSLYRKNRVGSLSAVEKAESAVNAISNQLQQIRQSRDRAKIKLARCVIRAPFTGRVSSVDVEQDEYVNPGQKMITLVNDASLEVVLSLDSRDAANWLRWTGTQGKIEQNWFAKPEPVPCTVVWSENAEVRGSGLLDRVVRFDSKTRMLTVAVSLKPSVPTSFPLVEGMFCRVTIPGRVLKQVYVVPREAVSFSSTVYVVTAGRLHTRRVTVGREEEDMAVITDGLAAGDVVITTRLENPLENALVRIVGQDGQ